MLLQTVRGVSVPRSRTSRVATMGGSSTGNTSQINALLDKVGAMGGGEVSLSGSGTFRLSGTLLVNYSNVRLIIPQGMTLKLDDSATLASYASTDFSSNWQTSHAATFVAVKPVISTKKYNVANSKLDNIIIEGGGVIDCNGANQADSGSYAGILLASTTRSRVRGLKVINAGLSITDITTGQRGYNIALMDSDYFEVAYCEVDQARYDNIGGRGYTLGGTIRNNLIRGTVGTNSSPGTRARAGFQWAYQGFKIGVHDNDFVQDGASDSCHCILMHGCRHFAITKNRMDQTNSAGGGCINVFGDNTAGGDVTHDTIGTFPHATQDELGEQYVIADNVMRSLGTAAPTLNLDTVYNRSGIVKSNVIEKTGTTTVCVQAIGSAGTSSDRLIFSNNNIRMMGTQEICSFQYIKGLLLSGNSFEKGTNNASGILIYNCTDPTVRDNRCSYSGVTTAMNAYLYLKGNTNAHVEGNVFSKASANIGYGVYVDQSTANTGLKIIRNDFTDCNTKVAFSATASAGSLLSDNIGYATENEGSATITAAATSVTVTHSVTAWRTLRAEDVALVLTNTTTSNIGPVSIQNVTSTQFDIVCTAAPGASTAIFRWRMAANRF
jgi:hypothetical protein